MLNNVNIMGRMVITPELKQTPSGVPITSFAIACETGRKNTDGTRITHFIDCVAWRDKAEHACKYLTKGRLVVLEGELETYIRERNGSKYKTTEVVIRSIHFADSKRAERTQPSDNFVEVDNDDQLPF